MNRGNQRGDRREPIFLDNEDRKTFLRDIFLHLGNALLTAEYVMPLVRLTHSQRSGDGRLCPTLLSHRGKPPLTTY